MRDDFRNAGSPLAEAAAEGRLWLIHHGGRTEGGFGVLDAAILLAPGIVSGEEGADTVAGNAFEIGGQWLFASGVDQGDETLYERFRAGVLEGIVNSGVYARILSL